MTICLYSCVRWAIIRLPDADLGPLRTRINEKLASEAC
jgi:hypothetical protein